MAKFVQFKRSSEVDLFVNPDWVQGVVPRDDGYSTIWIHGHKVPIVVEGAADDVVKKLEGRAGGPASVRPL